MTKRVPWLEAEVTLLLKLKEEGLTRREIAEKLGRTYVSVANKIQSLGGATATSDARDPKKDEKFEHSTKGDRASIVSVSERIRTPADALAFAEIDPKVWEIERQTVNSWEAAAKTEDGFQTITLWQIKLQLKRRAPK